MPLITESSYKKPFYLINKHFETIIPSLLRNVKDFAYDHVTKMTLEDGDFLKIGWKVDQQRASKKIVIISHGLEGDYKRPYVLGTAKRFHTHGWDVAGWNYRSCGGEMNRLPRLYHHGVSDDLSEVVEHVASKGYNEIALVGYSMGGSTTLKYLGEFPDKVNEAVKTAAVFSVPINLLSAARQLSARENKFYLNRFLKKLKKKVTAKYEQFNGDLPITLTHIDSIDSFEAFDSAYTAPLHGFKDAYDFYQKTSTHQFLKNINVPCLIVNAQNDPMLGETCYPYDAIRHLKHVYFETPTKGGHVGFLRHKSENTWAEERALDFINELKVN